ncbi:MAG TPA: 16S rRNA (uracil(1498)-N(3))-methyltransferase [Cyanobacteria bacterium UBA11049]|nr:16S rRNA (uracil(1498)-N(3))-methyltransferase [Cyanobacteria bacterium UBA11049]
MSQLQRLVIAPSQLQDRQILLTTQQHHYLSRVLRLRDGDRFIAMDGLGHWWLAVLADSKAEILETISVQTELPISITLLVALPKGNGFDEVVRCCTELGVSCIVPVISDRTLLHPSPQKLERWRRIAIEAAEQSERQFVPTILDPEPFVHALSSVNSDSLSINNHKYICVARGDSARLIDCLQNKGQITKDRQTTIIIATGPEGGWTKTEVERAIAAGFQLVSLGRRILRAVTAPVVALSLATAVFEGE